MWSRVVPTRREGEPGTRIRETVQDVRRRHLRGRVLVAVQHGLQGTAGVALVVTHVVHPMGLGVRHLHGVGLTPVRCRVARVRVEYFGFRL